MISQKQSHLKMEFVIRGLGKVQLDMVLECKYGLMEPSMKDTGRMGKPLEKENLFTLMEIFIKDNGKKIRHMAMECIYITMVQDMKDSGWKITNMDMVLRFGSTEASMRAIIRKARRMEKESMCGEIVATILGNGLRTRSQGMECMYGPMGGSIKEIG